MYDALLASRDYIPGVMTIILISVVLIGLVFAYLYFTRKK